MVIRDCYWHLVSGTRTKKDIVHKEEKCFVPMPIGPSLRNTRLEREGPSKSCQGIWILVPRKMVMRIRSLEWLPDFGLDSWVGRSFPITDVGMMGRREQR